MELKKIAVGLTALLGMSVANAHNVWLDHQITKNIKEIYRTFK